MRRATSLTDAPGANASATIARFCSSLHRRRRSGPDITSTRLIAPSFAPVQNTSLAQVPERAGSIPRAQGGRYRTVTVLAAPYKDRRQNSRCDSTVGAATSRVAAWARDWLLVKRFFEPAMRGWQVIRQQR